jgi:hypothetical protein
MHLESYGCELCILQKDESLRHMFVECSFAKKLLGTNWNPDTILVISNRSS